MQAGTIRGILKKNKSVKGNNKNVAKDLQKNKVPEKKKVRSVSEIDLTFLTIVTILLLFGFVMLFSASYANALYYKNDSLHYAKSQLLYIGVGLIFMFIMIHFDYRLWIKWAPIVYVATIILLIMVYVPGIAAPKDGIRRWINIFSFSFQPSEAAKFSVIVWFSLLAHKNQSKIASFKYGVIPFLVLLAPLVIFVYAEPHLSGTVLILAVAVVMMFIAGTRVKHFMILGAVAVALGAAYLLIKGMKPSDLISGYQFERILNWQDPFGKDSITDEVWQTCQSLIAIGSGGLMGVGFGNSTQKFLYLPEPQNDFIFAIVCEELGLLGATFVIILFMMLIWRGFTISSKAPDKFGSMLVIGIILQIGIQFLLNIAVVTNAIPNTGISLPFFSSGGTAMVVLLTEIGIILNVSRHSMVDKLK